MCIDTTYKPISTWSTKIVTSQESHIFYLAVLLQIPLFCLVLFICKKKINKANTF